MVGQKKKAKLGEEGSQEDRISKLPDALISDILYHLPTKDAVRTSVLSTRWRSLWQCVPGLDLDSRAFSNTDAFVSFVDRFFESHKGSCIRKLRLCTYAESYPSSWIDDVTTRRIQHFDLSILSNRRSYDIPRTMSILSKLMVVSLPCLKVMRLENIRYSNRETLENIISRSLVLEDLTMIRCRPDDNSQVLKVRSQTLKRIDIDECTRVVIDAPLLQCLRTNVDVTKKYGIIGSGFPVKLEFGSIWICLSNLGVIHEILKEISRVRDLVIEDNMWMYICLYSKSRLLGQFRYLSRLNARFCESDLELLPTLLESCPQLESLILELVEENTFSNRPKKKRQPKVTFSTVPRCFGTSLKFVEWKRSTKGYKGEMELVRYILKNSTILEKLKLDVYYTKKAKYAFVTELVAMPRCSIACEVIVL